MAWGVGLVMLFIPDFSFLAKPRDSLCADRTAVERFYHNQRSNGSQSFEDSIPQSAIETLVRKDQQKEMLLRTIYGLTITPTLVAREMERIQTTSHSPELLTGLKKALGDDPRRFARTIARPLLVERELHRQFSNDDKLHINQRNEAEQARDRLLTKQAVPGMRRVTWRLVSRDTDTTGVPPHTAAGSTSYTNQSTAQASQATRLARTDNLEGELLSFEDLGVELQSLLLVQLKKPGDVTALIEMPRAFHVFVAQEVNRNVLSALVLTIRKRDYDEWLTHQSQARP